MDSYEATIEVDARDEARAVRLLVEELYNTMREEFKTVYDETAEDEMLEELRTVREATQEETPGRLRVVYERTDDEFDE